MRMTGEQRAELLAHAREEAPNECCGLLKLRDGVVEEVVRLRNERQSPHSYSLDADGLLALIESEEAGYDVAIYHSHPKGPACPSKTDLAANALTNWLQVIVASGEVRAWRGEDEETIRGT